MLTMNELVSINDDLYMLIHCSSKIFSLQFQLISFTQNFNFFLHRLLSLE